jgi:hypothetical protein
MPKGDCPYIFPWKREMYMRRDTMTAAMGTKSSNTKIRKPTRLTSLGGNMQNSELCYKCTRKATDNDWR